ncbi:hypothetical protein DICVIV_13442 [Dictyocaulus viviparus]|uniref:Uncharacterized protein n=1 Tax=Dictyocaulus viviparus TaxID=29172 RepID=A0A0D8XAC9_DICVI|nr:hypothetical protein DICVIV_13442 [Dictyocaulus viviparus]
MRHLEDMCIVGVRSARAYACANQALYLSSSWLEPVPIRIKPSIFPCSADCVMVFKFSIAQNVSVSVLKFKEYSNRKESQINMPKSDDILN